MELREIVPEYYSRNIFVRKLFLKRLELAINLALPILKLNQKINIIDLGCGDGSFLKLLEENFKNINTFGIDILPEVLKIKEFLRAEIKISDLRRSGFPNNFFDIIFCLDTLEHFEDLEPAIREIKRILKNNGLMVISVPTENLFYKLGRLLIKGTLSMKKGPAAGSHFQNARAIIKFICTNGFEIVKKIPFPPLPFFELFYLVSFKRV